MQICVRQHTVASISLTYRVSFISGVYSVHPSLCFSYIPSLLLSLKEKNLDWFPRMRAMSLVSSEGDGEQNEMRSLQERLENTANLVAQLSGQLAELKEQVKKMPLQAVFHAFVEKHCPICNCLIAQSETVH